MCHCTCAEVQETTFGVGSLLPSSYEFFMQDTKHAGHMALRIEPSHQAHMSADEKMLGRN